MDYLVGLGLAYHISPSTSLFIEPTFTKNINPIVRLNNTQIHNQSNMLNLGMRWSL